DAHAACPRALSAVVLRIRSVTLMRKHSVFFLALIAALVLGACSFGPASEPPTGAGGLLAPTDAGAAGSAPTTESAGNVTITFGAIGFRPSVYEPLIASFNTQHPGITVRFVALDEVYQGGSDYSTQMRQIVSRADTAEAGANEQEFNLGLLHDLAPLM